MVDCINVLIWGGVKLTKFLKEICNGIAAGIGSAAIDVYSHFQSRRATLWKNPSGSEWAARSTQPPEEDPRQARMTNYGIPMCYGRFGKLSDPERANYNIDRNTKHEIPRSTLGMTKDTGKITHDKTKITHASTEMAPDMAEIFSAKTEITPAMAEIIPAKTEMAPAKAENISAKAEMTPAKAEMTPDESKLTEFNRKRTFKTIFHPKITEIHSKCENMLHGTGLAHANLIYSTIYILLNGKMKSNGYRYVSSFNKFMI
jgi:hypothetical protein